MPGIHKRKAHLISVIVFSTMIYQADAQPAIILSRLATAPLSYTCPYAGREANIVCDGRFNEPVWALAIWSGLFQDIEGSELPQPQQDTRVRMIWDDEALYVAAELSEKDIWATLRNHDDIIFRDNDFEVFISGDPNDPEYYEVEVNAFNTIFDLLLPRPYRDKGVADIPWNLQGLQSGVHVIGTLNQPGDNDTGWTVELKIPFRGLKIDGNGKPPAPGDRWRINFSRVEYDINNDGKSYSKAKDEQTGKDLPERNWVWSSHGIIDMHFPERWGYLIFQKGKRKSATSYVESDNMEHCLWLTYYAQRINFRKHGTWLDTPSGELQEILNRLKPSDSALTISNGPDGWTAIMMNQKLKLAMKIDNNGNFTRWKL